MVAADVVLNPLTMIAANGWQATWPTPPTLDPVGAPRTVAITRAGFDASGTALALVDRLTMMKRVRQPWPNQTSLTADQVALSDFVYATDTVSGMTNASTLAPPRPICFWLTPDLERATGATFTVQLAVAHAYARAGRPVAAVKFIASDGTHSVESLVTTMASRSFASGLSAPYFEAALDVTGLDARTICTVDVIVYGRAEGCPAVDRGTNQPDAVIDGPSSESALPSASRGWRDDAIQRASLEATLGYWGDPTHNPISPVSGAPMLDLANCAARAWDARPYPFFPQLADRWPDSKTWHLGHGLTGRLGALSLAALVRHLCARAGLAPDRIDF